MAGNSELAAAALLAATRKEIDVLAEELLRVVDGSANDPSAAAELPELIKQFTAALGTVAPYELDVEAQAALEDLLLTIAELLS